MMTFENVLVILGMAFLLFAYISTAAAITDRKRRWRAGETDYYGNEIKEEDKDG